MLNKAYTGKSAMCFQCACILKNMSYEMYIKYIVKCMLNTCIETIYHTHIMEFYLELVA